MRGKRDQRRSDVPIATWYQVRKSEKVRVSQGIQPFSIREAITRWIYMYCSKRYMYRRHQRARHTSYRKH